MLAFHLISVSGSMLSAAVTGICFPFLHNSVDRALELHCIHALPMSYTSSLPKS